MKKQRLDKRRNLQRIPMVILAGLPHPICQAVAKAVEIGLSPSPRVIHLPSGMDDGQLYRDKTVKSLLNAVSDYAVRQSKSQLTFPSPSQILLAYVPSPDEGRLLTKFDFFVFPVRLTRLAEYDEHGRQNRFDLKKAEKYVVRSLEAALITFAEIKRRLSSVSPKEPLFLPPRNFNVSVTERMEDVFRQMRSGLKSWVAPLNDIQTTVVTHEQLPIHVRNWGIRSKMNAIPV